MAYSNSFGAGFALDNRGLILEDTRIRDATPENLALIFQHTYWWPYGESGLYRPLTTLSYLFNYAILGSGTSPAGYHWINFLLHATNVLLVYALGLRLAGGVWGPAWIAAIWAVHPLLTESVTNIVGRADLLAGFAVLAGFLVYLKSTEAAGARRIAWLALLAMVTAMGVFAKESAVTVLGVIVLYEAIFWKCAFRETKQRPQAWGLVLGSIAVLIPTQTMLYQRAAVLFSSQPANFPFYDNPITGAGWLMGRLTALKVIGKYLGLLIWPGRLSCDYSWSQVPLARASASDFVWWLLLAASGGAVVMLVRRNRTGLWIASAAILVFLPTSNLLFPIGTIMAERFLYLPAIAFAAALVALAQFLPRGAPIVLGLIVTTLAVRTWARNADWQSDLTLATAAVVVSPESYKSHLLLANSLFEADGRANNERANIDRVLAEAEKSVAILQPLPFERNNASVLRRAAIWYLAKADLMRLPDQSAATSPEAAQACRRALELLQRCRTMLQMQFEAAAKRPGFDPRTDPLAAAPGEVDRLISNAYLKLGDTGRALDLSARAIDTEPGNPQVYRQYAQSLVAAGRRDQAITVMIQGAMLTLDPGLRQNVVELYQTGLEHGGCALMPGQNGSMALNPGCDTVHAHLCAATAAAIQLRVKGGRRDLAEQLKNTGVKDFRCPAAPLDAALAITR